MPNQLTISSLVTDRHRFARINAAAMRRYRRHRDAGAPMLEAWVRYDRVMDFAFDFLTETQGA